MPEHVYTTVELPMIMFLVKAQQILKGGSSFEIFRAQPKFRLRYPRGSFWSRGKSSNMIGYSTIEIAENYVRNQEQSFAIRSHILKCVVAIAKT